MRSQGEFRFGPGERAVCSGEPGFTGRRPAERSAAVRLRAALPVLALLALLPALSGAAAVRAAPRQEPSEPAPAPTGTTAPASAPEPPLQSPPPSLNPVNPSSNPVNPVNSPLSSSTPEERLVRVRRIFVESFGDDPISKQAEAMVVDALVKSKRFVVTENRDRADAILKGTAVEKRSQELHAISESGAASTAVVTQNSDYSANSSGSIDGRVSGGTGTIHGSSRGSASGSSSGVGVARSGAVEDSQVTTETIDDARISVRLVDPDGDVIWSTTQESRGAKYKGSSADAAEKVTKQLLREIAKIERPGP